MFWVEDLSVVASAVRAAEAGPAAVADLVVEELPVAGDQSIPTWLKSHATKEDLNQIQKLVSQLESESSGEVVPMIVRRSSAVSHVPIVLFLFLLLVFALGEYSLIHIQVFIDASLSKWSWLLLNSVFIIGAYFFCHRLAAWPFLQRWLTNDQDEVAQVWQRAELEFYREKMQNTLGRSGILIFISVMERRAVILADEGISAKIKPEMWQEIVTEMSLQLKKGEWVKAFDVSLLRCGELLKKHFPESVNSKSNELANFLRIKE